MECAPNVDVGARPDNAPQLSLMLAEVPSLGPWGRRAHPSAPTTEQLAELLYAVAYGAHRYYSEMKPVLCQTVHRDYVGRLINAGLDHLRCAAREGCLFAAGESNADFACEEMLRHISLAHCSGLEFGHELLEKSIGRYAPRFVAENGAVWVDCALRQYGSTPEEIAQSPGIDLAYEQDWMLGPLPPPLQRILDRGDAQVVRELICAIEQGVTPARAARPNTPEEDELVERVRLIERAPDFAVAVRAIAGERGYYWLSIRPWNPNRVPLQCGRRRARAREHRPAARRRAGASSSTSGADPGDSDPADVGDQRAASAWLPQGGGA